MRQTVCKMVGQNAIEILSPGLPRLWHDTVKPLCVTVTPKVELPGSPRFRTPLLHPGSPKVELSEFSQLDEGLAAPDANLSAAVEATLSAAVEATQQEHSFDQLEKELAPQSADNRPAAAQHAAALQA